MSATRLGTEKGSSKFGQGGAFSAGLHMRLSNIAAWGGEGAILFAVLFNI